MLSDVPSHLQISTTSMNKENYLIIEASSLKRATAHSPQWTVYGRGKKVADADTCITFYMYSADLLLW